MSYQSTSSYWKKMNPFLSFPYTTAQMLLLKLGVDPFKIEAHRSETRDRFNRNYHHTKRGPGRVHQQGKRPAATATN